MPTTPTVKEIEDYLLELVARERNVTVELLREQGEAKPYEPPWSSEDFVHYQRFIEEHFQIDFDPEAVEQVQHSIVQLSEHIQTLVAQRLALQA
jgi:hypothetical protein